MAVCGVVTCSLGGFLVHTHWLLKVPSNVSQHWPVSWMAPTYSCGQEMEVYFPNKIENFKYFNVAFISYKLTMWKWMLISGGCRPRPTFKKNRHLMLTEAPGCTLVAFFLTLPSFSRCNFEPYPLSCNTAGRQGGTLFSSTW